MIREPRASVVPAVVAILALMPCAVGLQMLRDSRYQPPVRDDETLYLTRRAVSRAVFTYRSLASDLYWIRAIQYYGGHTQEAKARAQNAFEPPAALAASPPVSFDLLYPLLDAATTLDPRFNIAYRFGAIFLSESYPNGPGRPDEAIALLEKGLRSMPDRWTYWQDIGFVHYWSRHDYTRAADAFARGARLPGAPWWLRSLAATTMARGGDRDGSRLLWRGLYEAANNDYARSAAALKLQQLDAIEIMERLQRVIDAFVTRTGSPVSSWDALINAGVMRGVPLDPKGVPFELAAPSRVELSRESPLFPLPIEPAARGGA